MDKFLERFSNFFVRSVAPSSIFFVLLFFNDMYFNDSKIKDSVINITKAEDKKETSKEISLNIKDLKISNDKEQIVITIDKSTISDDVKKSENGKSKEDDTKSNENLNINLIYIFIALIFISYGYLNQILTQFLDNFIKENYDEEDEKFNQLRKETKIKFLKNKNTITDILPLNDYNLYIFLSSDKSISVSTSYVDEVKNIHSLRIALLLSSLINFTYCDKYFSIPFFLLSIFIFCLLHEYAKSRYKVRNRRLYINYLLKKEENKLEKETKILYKGRSR